MFKSFCKDQSGNMTLISALSLLPVLAIVGAAVDTSFAMKKQDTLQNAIDNAALAAIHESNSTKAAWIFYQSLRSKGFDSEDNIQIKSFRRAETRGGVTVKATVQGTHTLAFGSLLGRSETDYTVATSVVGSKKISSIRFVPTFGSGYLNKEFELWVNRPNTTVPERLATYTWTSSAPITFRDGTSPGTLDSSRRGPIDLGNYTDFFMTTTITDPWNTYSREQMVEVYGEDYTISSREPGHGDHFFVNGEQLPINEMVNFTRDFSCDQRNQNFEWEDAPGLAQPGTDFRFRVEARCDAVDSDTIRINK